jgi:ABC-type transport system involved in multi-copper enzyme maturation permease subunit
LESVWKNDLPEGFDPMTVKELRQSLRRGSFVYPFLGIQVLAVGAMIMEFKFGHDSPSTDFAGMLNLGMLASSGPFWMVVAAICLLLMPMAGVILMGQELEEGNHELLLLTKLDRWKIVIGKFAALWGICTLTFISLLPYVVVRYFIGGIEWAHEAACAATILGGSAILCAGAIGASAFKRMAIRVAVLVLFFASTAATCGIPLFFAALANGACGWIYHFTAISAVVCQVVIGLGLARSRLRLSIMPYEMNPSSMIIGAMIFAPFVMGFFTAITVGYGGGLGLLGIAVFVATLDITPKAPRWVPAPPPNLPPTEVQE